MEFKLFNVSCKNEECGHSFVSSYSEHIVCPSCGEETLNYSSDAITVYSNDIFFDDIDEIMEHEDNVLTGVLIASSYISDDETIARFDDYEGFRLNLKESDFTDKIVKLSGLSSINEIEDFILANSDCHSDLIYDPIIPCIQREHYSDEEGYLFELGYVCSSQSKKVYKWIKENMDYVARTISETKRRYENR